MNISDLKVLVVEDDDFQRSIIVGILHSLGIAEVSEAGNGRQGLEIIRGNSLKPVNVAICDLNMPEMDGMEFLRHVGEEQRNVAVILTSSLDSKLLASVGKMTKMYGIPLLGVIEKPVLLTNLKELLSKYDDTPANKVHKPAAKRFALEEILKGIQDNQFEPFFQPKVDMKTGRLVGAEALARWVHPEHGVVSPDAFIPPLEQTGNIDDLTFHILEKSAAACRLFHAEGRLLTISVNLSLVSLDDTALADRITKAVRESGVEPQYIVLEITESAAMTNVAPALENLVRLCVNGFALSIDDYGTGSSNLQQLTRVAFSELKIDQSFVKDFGENKALRTVVESSIDMAHKLLVKSVAEGVETQQEWDALKAIGCDTVQGYFIARPMDVKAFGSFIANYKHQFISLSPYPAQPPARQQNQIRILLVEDDNFTRKIMLRVLHDLGFSNTVEASSALAAIQLLGANTFDLIITDVNMPGMNGLKFIQMIRSGKTLAKPETRIVVLTLFSQTEILGSALALDINGFLVKPIIPAVVEEKLTLAMSEHLHLHSPMAYESVKTEAKSLPRLDSQSSRIQGRASTTIGANKTQGGNGSSNARPLPLSRLRPGMTVEENVYLKDGTLVLSSGHTLSELSINRLHDIRDLLPANGVAAQ